MLFRFASIRESTPAPAPSPLPPMEDERFKKNRYPRELSLSRG